MKSLGVIVLALIGGAALLLMLAPPPPPLVEVKPVIRPKIILPNRPLPRPCPDCPRPRAALSGPWLPPLVAAQVGGRIAPDGCPLSVDYPAGRHLRNRAGSDGLGLCVYAANSMALDWHGHEYGRELLTFMERRPGGGYPAKTDADLKAFFAALGQPVPRYLHYEGADLSVLDAAVSAGRMVCGTYYRSPTGRYAGQRIAHMVDWVHADGQKYAVLDNNHTGDRSYEWMTRQEAEKCIKDSRGRFWLMIWLDVPPPPPPHNPKEMV